MQQLNGVWWTLNHKQVPGILTITDENIISLVTYEKLYNSNIINGFSDGEKITLVDAELDRTDVYYDNDTENQDEELKYATYKYKCDSAIFGHTYEKKGEIRIQNLKITYTNLDKWVNWESKEPKIEKKNEDILLTLSSKMSKIAKLDKFDFFIAKPYTLLTQGKYNMQINNETIVCIDNIANPYMQSLQEIIVCIQFFLVLCMGDNINVEKINATDIQRKEG